MKLVIKAIDKDFSVCKVLDYSKVNFDSEYVFLGKTPFEYSLVCETTEVPLNSTAVENNWKMIKIEGVLDFSLVGIIANISSLLSKNEISVFTISTYNTDYILVKKNNFSLALKILSDNGYDVI